MGKDTNAVRPEAAEKVRLDAIDRKLLSLLVEDATRSYADLGSLVELTAPAVFERVKRLKLDGVIKATTADLDGAKLGRPLLAFIHVDTKLQADGKQILELSKLPDVQEVHTVTGTSAMLLKIRTRNTLTLQNLLVRIHGIEGIAGTHCHIVLSTYMERGPNPLLD